MPFMAIYANLQNLEEIIHEAISESMTRKRLESRFQLFILMLLQLSDVLMTLMST